MVKFLESKAEFDAALKEAGNKLVVVDFTASWCPPCRAIGPKFEAMATEFADAVFYKVDVDKNEETATAEGINAMPTFIFYKNGKKVDDLTGADEEELRELILKHKEWVHHRARKTQTTLQETAEAEGVNAMPTFIFYKNGRKADDLTGADEEKLRELIVKHK